MVENEKNIIFTGTQMDGNLDALFTHAYAYVLPSENEGLSISFLEAMAHGLPLIASEIEANQDFIDKGLIYGFKNKDVQGLKTKMSWMIENYDTALAKAQKTAEYIQENFSWNKIANQIQELYKQNECLQNLHKKAFVQKTSK